MPLIPKNGGLLVGFALSQCWCIHAAEQVSSSGQDKPVPSPIVRAELPVAPVQQPGDTAAQVLELPKMTVLAPKENLPQEKDVLSSTDKAAMLRKRYPGASFKGQDPERSQVPNYAALMYREDERLRQLRAVNDLAAGVREAGDAKAAAALEKDAAISLMRRHDLRTEAMDRSANNDRR